MLQSYGRMHHQSRPIAPSCKAPIKTLVLHALVLLALVLLLSLWNASCTHLPPAIGGQVSFNINWQHQKGTVVDGDTVRILLNHMPRGLEKVNLRIAGVNSPELRLAKGDACRHKEIPLGKSAKAFVEQQLNKVDRRQVRVIKGRDKKVWEWNNGRIVGDVLLNGQRLSSMLLQHGHAEKWDGKGERTRPWCHDS